MAKGTIVSSVLLNTGEQEVRITNDTVYLWVPVWARPRRIGSIQKVNGHNVFFRPFNPSKHTMFRINSVGFNAQLFSIFPDTMYLALRQSGGKTLYANVGEARNVLKSIDYIKDGYDKQVFVPLENFSEEAPKAETSKEDRERAKERVALEGEGASDPTARDAIMRALRL